VVGTGLRAMVFIAFGRRKKEEAVIAMVLAVKNVLTVLAVAIDKIRILKSLLDKLSSLSLETKKSAFSVRGF
jgi:hypothetical protein